MSVTLTLAQTATVAEVLTGNTVGVATSAQKTVTHNNFNVTKSLNSGTTPPVSLVAAFNAAMVESAYSIDLTALTGTNGLAVNGTGLHVVALQAIAKATNISAVTLAEGASNGYELLGGSWAIALLPGQSINLYTAGTSPTIGASAKVIDMTGTTGESVDFVIVIG